MSVSAKSSSANMTPLPLDYFTKLNNKFKDDDYEDLLYDGDKGDKTPPEHKQHKKKPKKKSKKKKSIKKNPNPSATIDSDLSDLE
jgi:hypothetical protein